MGGNPGEITRYNDEVPWIYLSPHFDDVALSCGGLLWEQSHAGEMVHIWTVCAGGPAPGSLSVFAQELHTRWEAGQNAAALRKLEDINSCRRLGAAYRHFLIPDCIYRRDPDTGEFMYASEQALNGPIHPGDLRVIADLVQELGSSLPAEADLVCPLALGSHVDHQLTRQAAQGLGRRLWYYADFPYVLRYTDQLERMQSEGWNTHDFPISPEGLAAWQSAIEDHASQISTFWPTTHALRRAVQDYLQGYGGIRLWTPPVRE